MQVGPDGIHSGADVNGPRARRALHGKGDRRDPDERQRQARHGLLGQLDALPLVQLLRGQGGAAAAIVRAQGLPGLLEGGRHAPVGGAPAGPMHQPGIVGGRGSSPQEQGRVRHVNVVGAGSTITLIAAHWRWGRAVIPTTAYWHESRDPVPYTKEVT